MSALALRTGAYNLGQGFPDDDAPPAVRDAARQAIDDGLNQYPPGIGMETLRVAIAEHQARFYGLAVDPAREVLVTAGATEALAATILALAGPGDEVLTFEPYYDAYAGLIALAGAAARTVRLHAPAFHPDLSELEAAFSDSTRIVLVNTPHNPTGAVMPDAALEVIVRMAERHDALIVTDEVYEHLVFDDTHRPIASIPGAEGRTITISSAGKTFSATGWKIGWVTAAQPLIEAITAVKQFLTYVNGAPFQPAIAVGLRLPDSYFAEAAASLRMRRDLLTSGLERAGFRVFSAEAGYFVVADAAPLGFTDAAEFCRALPERTGVVGVPVSAFCGPDALDEYRSLVRFAFCKSEQTIRGALTGLERLGRTA